jgi:tetratricopeptide (TPR) repeat protein
MGDRAHKHAVLASWMAERFPEPREGVVVGVLAQHVEQAVRLNKELERTDPGLAASAFHALLAAAQEAERFEARHDAERWYRRALDLGTSDRELRNETLVAHARTLVHLGRLDDARHTLEDAALTVDPESRAGLELLTWLAVVARLQGDLEAARSGFDLVQRRQRAAGDRLGQAIALRLQGWSELLAGRPRAALPRLRQASGLLHDGDPVGERGETLRCLGWCGFLVGDPAARAHLETAATLLSDAGDPGGATWCVGILGFSHLQRGDIDAAIEVAELLLDRARERGDSWGMATCTLLLAAARLERGDLRRATALAEAATRRFAELDDAWGQAMSALLQGMASRAAGDLEASRAHLLRGLALAPRVAYVGEESRLLSELARVELDAGDLAEATRRARSSLALVRSGVGEVDSEVRALQVLAEVALAEDDQATARLLLEQAVGTGLRAVGPPSTGEEDLLGDQARDLASNTTRQAAARLSVLLYGWGDPASAEAALGLATAGELVSAPTRVATAQARAAALSGSGRATEAAEVLGEVLDAYGSEDFAFLGPMAAWRSSLLAEHV